MVVSAIELLIQLSEQMEGTSMLSQDPGSETQFILVIFLIAVSVFGLMLIGVLIAALPQIRSRGKPAQTSSTGLSALSSEKAPSAVQTAREIESTPLSPLSDHIDAPCEHERELIEEAHSAAEAAPDTELTSSSPLEDRIESTTEQGREIPSANTPPIRQILGVALTGVLMVAPLLVLSRFIGIVIFYLAPFFLPLCAALAGIWTALAGAIGFRVAKLSWRQTVLAAFLAGATLLVIAGFMFRGIGGQGGFWLLLSFGGMVWVSGGVFLLPLFDPAVSNMGPALSSRKVAKTALAPALLFLVLVIFSLLRAWSHPDPRQLSASDQFVGVFFTVFPLVLLLVLLPVSLLLAAGLTITLFAPSDIADPDLKGSWLGGVGILFLCFTLVGLVVMAVIAALVRG